MRSSRLASAVCGWFALACLVRCAGVSTGPSTAPSAVPSNVGLLAQQDTATGLWRAVLPAGAVAVVRPGDVVTVWRSSSPVAVGIAKESAERSQQGTMFSLEIQCQLPETTLEPGLRVELLRPAAGTEIEGNSIINMGYCLARTTTDKREGAFVQLNIGAESNIPAGATYRILPKDTLPSSQSTLSCTIAQVQASDSTVACFFPAGTRSNSSTLDQGYALYTGQAALPPAPAGPVVAAPPLQHTAQTPTIRPTTKLVLLPGKKPADPSDVAIGNFRSSEEQRKALSAATRGVFGVLLPEGISPDQRPTAFFSPVAPLVNAKEESMLLVSPLCRFQTKQRQAILESGMVARWFAFDAPPPLGGCVVKITKLITAKNGLISSVTLNLGLAKDTVATVGSVVRLLPDPTTLANPGKPTQCKIQRVFPGKSNTYEKMAVCQLLTKNVRSLENAFGIVERFQPKNNKKITKRR